ncbi:MAG: hypothetical protein LUI06_03495 [Ruminococcus sp.]|nr:hypothetical protein [Ruminococcus sp.]
MKGKVLHRSSIACFVCIIMSILVAFLGTFKASADSIGSLTLDCHYGDEKVENMSWSIYKIGERDISGGFAIDDAFSSTGVALDDLSASAVQTDADTLAAYVSENEVTALATAYTNENGLASFSELDYGIYLVIGQSVLQNEYTFTASPSIIEISADESQVTATTKLSAASSTSSESTPDESSSEEDSSSTPDSSSETSSEDSSTPDSSSETSSEDSSSETSSEDSLSEDSSSEDSSSETSSEDIKTDTSSDKTSSTPPTTTTTTTSDTIPPTGQRWVSVSLFAIVGLVLIAMGVRICIKKEADDE